MKKKRVTSIDVFRGLTLMLMILVNDPGAIQHTYKILEHASWNGCSPPDLGFPFFIFVMGMAIPFGVTENGGITKELIGKFTVRCLRLVNLGLAINYFGYFYIPKVGEIGVLIFHVLFAITVGYLSLGKFRFKFKLYSALALLTFFIALPATGFPGFDNVRIPGVLQRIGVVYLIAGLLFVALNFRQQVIVGIFILLGYWALLAWVPVPGLGHPSLTKDANLVAYVDNKLLSGHLWATTKTWDPEGILSTIPSIVSCLAGVWCGKFIKQGISTLKFVWAGIACLAVSIFWSQYLPFNKALWTSSFVVYCIGWALLIIAVFIRFLDGKEKGPFTHFMLVWGLNPILLYYGSEILSRFLLMIPVQNTNWGTFLYLHVFSGWFTNLNNASLLSASVHVLVWFIILAYLKKKNWLFSV